MLGWEQKTVTGANTMCAHHHQPTHIDIELNRKGLA